MVVAAPSAAAIGVCPCDCACVCLCLRLPVAAIAHAQGEGGQEACRRRSSRAAPHPFPCGCRPATPHFSRAFAACAAYAPVAAAGSSESDAADEPAAAGAAGEARGAGATPVPLQPLQLPASMRALANTYPENLPDAEEVAFAKKICAEAGQM